MPEALQENAELDDPVETTDRYVIGTSYAPVINRHPGLAKVIRDYGARLRAELIEAKDRKSRATFCGVCTAYSCRQ